jgi:hypothetical protein
MEINGAASTISPGVRRSRLRQRMIEQVEKVGFYGRLLTGGSMHTGQVVRSENSRGGTVNDSITNSSTSPHKLKTLKPPEILGGAFP